MSKFKNIYAYFKKIFSQCIRFHNDHHISIIDLAAPTDLFIF